MLTSAWVKVLSTVLALALAWPVAAFAQQSPPAPSAAPAPAVPPGPGPVVRELIAVLDLEAVDASKSQASAMTDRLREELLATGQFTLVNREQIEAILNEQAFQQAGCTSQECAVQVGRMLGVRKIVAGRVTKLDETHWLLAATLTDVESARTERAESVRYEGSFFDLLDAGIGLLASKLAGVAPKPEALAGAAVPPPPAQEEKKSGSSWVWWVLGGLLVVGAAAAGGKKDSSSGPTTAVDISW